MSAARAGFPDLDAMDAALLDAARTAADAAAQAHREGSANKDNLDWSIKGRSDFVTEVDMEAESRIVDIITSQFPGHSILAEEGTGSSAGPAGGEDSVTWIIDPLDGTTNWLHGYPEYAVSIAAADSDGLRVGVVLNSATGECFDAVRGRGSRLDGVPITVSGTSELDLALIGTGFPFKKLEVIAAYVATFERVLVGTSGVRRAGAAALDLCAVAAGRLDGFFEYHLMPWDVAAGALIVREAGGHFETLDVPGLMADGEPSASGLPAGGFVASNRLLWQDFLELIG
ncbi:MAG: inositol monophosphatase family protein [Gemmatimonadota bacterium]